MLQMEIEDGFCEYRQVVNWPVFPAFYGIRRKSRKFKRVSSQLCRSILLKLYLQILFFNAAKLAVVYVAYNFLIFTANSIVLIITRRRLLSVAVTVNVPVDLITTNFRNLPTFGFRKKNLPGKYPEYAQTNYAYQVF